MVKKYNIEEFIEKAKKCTEINNIEQILKNII